MKQSEIFNSDQGSQFTATAFTSRLEECGVAISMDGRGRAIDNVFVERLWRSVKYEEVYLKDYQDGWEAEANLQSYFHFTATRGFTRRSATARRPRFMASEAEAQRTEMTTTRTEMFGLKSEA